MSSAYSDDVISHPAKRVCMDDADPDEFYDPDLAKAVEPFKEADQRERAGALVVRMAWQCKKGCCFKVHMRGAGSWSACK